ncbi:MAG: glycosyltransferase family 2 protein [Bryobacteraceae bacterium]
MLDRLFVVIPAYNEGAVLASTAQDILHHGWRHVVIVDDGSTDETQRVAGALPVHYLRHLINLGQGAALQTGTDFALAQGAGIVVHFDADGQHPARQIAALARPIEDGEADVVLGSRFLDPADAAKVPKVRRWMLRAAAGVTNTLYGVDLTDAHNGLRALSRHAAQRILLHENRYGHASEIIAQIRKHGLRYREVPVTIRYTRYSLSKGQPLSNSLELALDLLRGRFRR